MKFLAGNPNLPRLNQVSLRASYERRKDLEVEMATKVGLSPNQVEVHAASDKTRAAQNMIAVATSRSQKPPRVLWSILHGQGILVMIKLHPPEDSMKEICAKYDATPPTDIPGGLLISTRFFRFHTKLAQNIIDGLARATNCPEWELFYEELGDYLKKMFAKIAAGLHGDTSELDPSVFCLWGSSNEPALDLSKDFIKDYFKSPSEHSDDEFICEDSRGLIVASLILLSMEIQKILAGVSEVSELKTLEGREYSLEIILKKIEAQIKNNHQELYDRREEISLIYTRGRRMIFRFCKK